MKCFNDPFLEEPHVKLFVIDMVNYFLSLLEAEDRRTLISELHEQQLVLDEDDPEHKIL